MIKYPTVQAIINTNKRIVEETQITKAEKFDIITSETRIQNTIDEAENYEGSLTRKAAILMHGLMRNHNFGSGNKRTAFVIAHEFLLVNSGIVPYKLKSKKETDFIKGIKAGRYSIEQIARWLDNEYTID